MAIILNRCTQQYVWCSFKPTLNQNVRMTFYQEILIRYINHDSKPLTVYLRCKSVTFNNKTQYYKHTQGIVWWKLQLFNCKYDFDI